MNKLKNILVLCGSAVVIVFFMAVLVFTKPTSYSSSERRVLASFPQFTLLDLKNGDFMTDFELWTQDQFPFRDTFRKIKATVSTGLMRQADNHGFYMTDGYISKLEYPKNQDNLNRNLSVLNDVYNKYLKGTSCKTYLSVISDKNRFLTPVKNHPSMDYDEFISEVKDGLKFAKYIDISHLLCLNDFYFTDQHWKQESITDIAQKLLSEMGAPCYDGYTTLRFSHKLSGAYKAQSCFSCEPDDVNYCVNDAISACKVYSYATGTKTIAKMYDEKAGAGLDAYDFFLGGSQPLLVIDNPNAKTDKELVLFRDSFGSSLAPLLTSGYKKITLVDLRYIKADLLPNYVTFVNQDVLFLYSTLVLNNSLSS